MKKRSITSRNLTGGFCGGILGILGFGYIHPAVLPLGCILGVLGGWWYQEIFQSAVEGWHKGMKKTHEAWDRTVLFLTTPTKKLKDANINLEFPLKIVHFVVFLVIWVFRSPITFYRWLKRHPMNQVYTLQVLAIIAAIELTAFWMFPLGIKINQIVDEAGKDSFLAGLLLISSLILGITAVMAPLMYPVGRSESLRGYSSWSAYSRQGTILFFLREVGMAIVCQAIMLLTISGAGIWFVAVGGAFVALIIAPLSFIIGMVKGIYKVATMESGHWLCLVTTLVVTLISAWQMHSYFADVRILWAVALMTGVVSAMTTEGLRQLFVTFCERNDFIKKVALEELGSSLAPSNKAFWKLTNFLGERYFQLAQSILG